MATTRPRSFRLSTATLDLLERRARERGESANQLAARLLDEALRLERHPLICFRQVDDRRRAALVGSRLLVSQVVGTVRESGGSVERAAEYLEIDPRRVAACLDYHGEHREEIAAEIVADLEFAREQIERERRRREVAV